jgi:hypothetical protein
MEAVRSSERCSHLEENRTLRHNQEDHNQQLSHENFISNIEILVKINLIEDVIIMNL